MQTRDYAIAARTVLDEAYADGDFANPRGGYTYQPDDTAYNSTAIWELNEISNSLMADDDELSRRAYDLVGRGFPANAFSGDKLSFIGLVGSTWQNADGLMCLIHPEGFGSGNPLIVVTYKIVRVDIANGSTQTQFNTKLGEGHSYDGAGDTSIYDPNAGYEVYRLLI
ncbi:MAG: hypothetical protein LBJ48_02550 [Coriobacteriales bacterium]|nr:hypothetical protein [Coriobacteriales bacterium]